METDKTQGTVKWFNNTTGQGVISLSDGTEVSVHYTEIQMPGFKTVDFGDVVEFDLVQGRNGPEAKNVTKLNREPVE
jgi:CspA family cold shock protein